MKAPITIAMLAATLALPHDAATQGVVVYRCTSADGAVTLQNDRRCPKGSREERRVLEAPTSSAPPALPAPIAAPAPVMSLPPASGTAQADAAASASGGTSTTAPAATPTADATPAATTTPSPAPPVFACRTWDGARYYGETEQPAPRCAPLETVGLDGRSAGGGQACELRADTCEPVLESARCDAWAERLRAAESGERFGADEDQAAAARTEAARLRALLAGTVCAR